MCVNRNSFFFISEHVQTEAAAVQVVRGGRLNHLLARLVLYFIIILLIKLFYAISYESDEIEIININN